MIQAFLSNRRRPDLPPVQILFPIDDYTGAYQSLQSLEIGSVAIRDCFVKDLTAAYPILKRLEETEINIDELDYLAKRLDSFDKYELAQFQGVAVSQNITNMTDFINLTFCCQSATVVQDFSDLSSVGRKHYLDLHGAMSEEELKTVDFSRIGLSLLQNEEGTITPYGVVYENDMKLEPCYDGLYFPYYQYNGDTLLVVAVKDCNRTEEPQEVTWLYLPAEDCQIDRALLRSGISEENLLLEYTDSELPAGLVDLLGTEESLYEVNKLCTAYQELDQEALQKCEAVLQLAQPSGIAQGINLLDQLDLFDFTPGISTPEEYGRYMITESGHFVYDGELDEFYDFKKYGNWRIANEHGQFTETGYISYHGFLSIEEVLAGSQSERMDMQMGSM